MGTAGQDVRGSETFDRTLVRVAAQATTSRIAGYRAFVVGSDDVADLEQRAHPGGRRILRDDDGRLYAGILVTGPNMPLNVFSYFFGCPISDLGKGQLDELWIEKQQESKEASCQRKSHGSSSR